jgi:TctA family transporter
MTISEGDVLIFVQKPLSLALLVLALLALAGTRLWRVLKKG